MTKYSKYIKAIFMKEKKHWQLEISSMSLKKNKKLRKIMEILSPLKPKKALDIGCDKGVISYYLRKFFPWEWISCDILEDNIIATKELVKKNVIKIQEDSIPFEDKYFDMVICIDLLEHINNDSELLKEINRLLSKGDPFIVSVPNIHPLLFVNYLARLLGINKEHYNHKRDGYSHKDLRKKLKKHGFRVERKHTVIGPFTELIEFSLNYIYIKFFNKKMTEKTSKGSISISNQNDYQKQKKKLKILKIIYPLIYLISLFDFFLSFLPGYILILESRKEEDL